LPERHDEKIACEQLDRSKRDIENHTGKPCQSICFPNGSYTDETIALAEKSKYICGVTTVEGLNCIGDDLMKLRRIGVPNNVSGTDLYTRVCGFSTALSKLKARLLKSVKRRN